MKIAPACLLLAVFMRRWVTAFHGTGAKGKKQVFCVRNICRSSFGFFYCSVGTRAMPPRKSASSAAASYYIYLSRFCIYSFGAKMHLLSHAEHYADRERVKNPFTAARATFHFTNARAACCARTVSIADNGSLILKEPSVNGRLGFS